MEESSASSKRRQEIMQYLQQEREKRKEKFELEDFEHDQEVTHSFRSETIARLVQERRNQDLYQLSKSNLQEALKSDAELKGKIDASDSSELSPQTWHYEQEIEILQSPQAEKPQKREIFKTKGKVLPGKVEVKEKENEKRTGKKTDLPKQIDNKMQVRMKAKKSEETLAQVHSAKNSKGFSSVSSSEKEIRKDNFEKRIDELMKIKEETVRQREMEKKKKDEDELKQCSFAPQVTPYFTKHSSIEKIEDRLMKLGQEQQKNREKVLDRQLIKDKELQETSCKFIPKISENSSNMIKNHQPIHERLEDLQKERMEIINKLRNNVEAKQESNFKPKINPQSSKLASNRSASIDNSQSKETYTSKKRVQEDIIQSEIQNFTFTPNTSSKPSNLKDFYDRQDEFQKKKEEKLQKKHNIEDTCTFKPSINSNSRCMALDDEGDKYERMSKQELAKRQQKQAKIQEDYYSKFSYEPKINPTSKLICRNSTYESKAISIPVQEETDSFSFKPKLESKKYKNVQSHYKDPGNILGKIKEKEKEKQEKLMNLKQEYEEKETKQCTFQPKIVELNENKETVLVPGFDKFMAWKELSKKQEEEKKQREFKAFGIKGNNSSITIPQPFNLAPDKKVEKLEKIKQEIDDQFTRECPFKPKTLES